MHGAETAMLKGTYDRSQESGAKNQESGTKSQQSEEVIIITCALRNGRKKLFRRGQKDYQRMTDHIGLLPLVIVSPADHQLIEEGSDERRRFLDSVISQYDRVYLEHITVYQQLLKQRNALLKQCADRQPSDSETAVFGVLEEQMTDHASYIHQQRQQFIELFIPHFRQLYKQISGDKEQVSLRYISQLDSRNMLEALQQTRNRDLLLGWTSQGIHKDELEMTLGDYPLRQVGSQGQQKTYLLALKLAQAIFLSGHLSPDPSPEGRGEQQTAVSCQQSAVRDQESGIRKPILLLDDIFDKLDSERVERIISLVGSDLFGQILITDTDRQHISELLRHCSASGKVFEVTDGKAKEI